MDFETLWQEREAARRQSIQDCVRAVQDGDVETFFKAIKEFISDDWVAALREIAKGPVAPAEFQKVFLNLWVMWETIRERVDDDDAILDACPKLLPPYTGPGQRLYRGETVRNHQSGEYRWAWTTSVEVAESFAKHMRVAEGGSLVLAVDAPAESIFCSPADFTTPRDGEDEYLVDRRVLARLNVEVRVVKELSQIDFHER